ICGSDLHMYEGRTSFETGRAMGHENLGQVVEARPACRCGPGGPGCGYLSAENALVKAKGCWRIELHVASAWLTAPAAHCLSRVEDHMASRPIPFDAANSTSCVASATVKISLVTSFTPIIGVTATAFHAPASESPSTPLICACVAVAAWTAYWPMSPLYAGP
ncbi:alcohol dehydrogenase catalytic domain-containing protein, partial [Streptomyces sp. NPDC006459]|uniref:alcohol dehydrogenase catalytic domain-containing protein n=1 Tax=Streptomyces sp. NPDC006459 TaxID=3154303 RepID=UPI0033AB3B4F